MHARDTITSNHLMIIFQEKQQIEYAMEAPSK